VGTKIRVGLAILALRTQPNAVGERGFETVEIGSHHIRAPVDYDAGQVLADALAHDSGLTEIHAESLLDKKGGDMCREPLDMPRECVIARKGKIIGVTRVFGAD
jgi:hypothetical protein